MTEIIFFDAFGTLFSWGKISSSEIVRALIAEEKRPSAENFSVWWKAYYRGKTIPSAPFITEREIFTMRMKDVFSFYGIEGDPANEVKKFYERAYVRDAYPDVKPALAALKKKYGIYVASNTDNDVLQAVMKRNGITADGVFTSEDLKCYKPDRRFFESILRGAGVDCEKAVFIGDSIRDDIEGAKQVGMKTILIDRTGKAGYERIPTEIEE